MANKEFFSRIIHKHDTEANWRKAINFIPLAGELIIYDIDTVDRTIVIEEETIVIPACNYQRFKIGNGTDKVIDLPFFNKDIRDILGNVNDEKDSNGSVFARIAKNVFDIDEVNGKYNALDNRISNLEQPLLTKDITHENNQELLSNIIENYILNIDYNSLLKFDVNEIVIGTDITTSVLGKAILGTMILG